MRVERVAVHLTRKQAEALRVAVEFAHTAWECNRGVTITSAVVGRLLAADAHLRRALDEPEPPLTGD